MSLVVPVVGDQMAWAPSTVGIEAEHGRKTRTRAAPAIPMASAAYVRVVIVVVPLLVDIRAVS